MNDPATTPSFQYDERSAKYATQFLISAGVNEIILDCSSGAITDQDGASVLPVHTRLAMPWSAAEQLRQLLDRTFEGAANRNAGVQVPLTGVGTDATGPTAQLPTLGSCE